MYFFVLYSISARFALILQKKILTQNNISEKIFGHFKLKFCMRSIIVWFQIKIFFNDM